MGIISKPIQKGAVLRKSISTIDKIHPLLEKKCAYGTLENIKHGSQVLLVSSLTIVVFYYSLHLEARIPPQAAFKYSGQGVYSFVGSVLIAQINYFIVSCLFRMGNGYEHWVFDIFPILLLLGVLLTGSQQMRTTFPYYIPVLTGMYSELEVHQVKGQRTICANFFYVVLSLYTLQIGLLGN